MYKLSAIELRNLFLKKEVSAKEIALYFLRRIEAFDPNLKAFLQTLNERAVKKAELLDKKRRENAPLGKLAAVPIVLKDNMHIKGEITTCSCRYLENYRAPFDATVVRLLEEEDALFIGKTNLDEFAMGSSTENSAFFPTHNPWKLDCVPGGSSGGSAAAVAARLAPIGLGSDTGGSIRQPASLCGIVGFKPTYGRVSRYGLVAFASSMDQIGPLTTTVADSCLIMETIGKKCAYDSTCLNLPQENYLEKLPSSLKGMKIGVSWPFMKDVKEDILQNFTHSLNILQELGAEIVNIDLEMLKYSLPVYYILAPAEASTNLARFDGIRYGRRSHKAKTLEEIYDLSRDEGFGEEVKRRILLGTFVLSSGYIDAYYKKAQKVRTLIINTFDKAFSDCHLIAMPTSPSTAFPVGAVHDPIEMYLQDIFTIPANLAGLPGINIPSGFDQENKPYGLQLLGPQLHDVLLLGVAHLFETETASYARKIPPLFDKELS